MENQKEIIFNKAIELIGMKGFDGVGIREIAKSANVSPALVYNYFSGKEDLLANIIRVGIEDVKSSFVSQNEELTIDSYFNNLVRIISEHKNLWRIIHQIRLSKDISQYEEAIELTKFINQSIARLLNCQEANEKVELAFALIDGIIAHYLILPNYNIKKQLDNAKQIFHFLREKQ